MLRTLINLKISKPLLILFLAFLCPLLSWSQNCSNVFEPAIKTMIRTPKAVTDQVARKNYYHPKGVLIAKKESEMIDLVNLAREQGLKISVKTGGFSQGGQWVTEKGYILDLSQYKGLKIHTDPRNPTVTFKAGTTWAEIQAAADKYGLANSVQQSSNIFPAGGALGINAHGRDIKYGSIINVTNWIDVLLPSGKVVRATKDNKYADVFKDCIGGLGLSGVILRANIKLRPNKIYETIVLKGVPTAEIGQVFHTLKTQPHLLKKYLSDEDAKKIITDFDHLTPDQIGLGYGRMQNLNPRSSDYLNESLVYVFAEVPSGKIKKQAKTHLKTKKSPQEYLIPAMMELQRLSHTAKSLREFLEEKLMRQSGTQSSLNYLMNPPVDFLLFKAREERQDLKTKLLNKFKKALRFMARKPIESTDVLKEYFIPESRTAEFQRELVKVIHEYNLNNLNITLRTVPKTPEDSAPTINYAKDDMVAYVINFNVSTNPEYAKTLDEWTERLVEAAVQSGGAQYLAYESNATLDQLLRAYPGFKSIFDKMQRSENPVFYNSYIDDYYKEYTSK